MGQSVASLKSWHVTFADYIRHRLIEERLIHRAREADKHLKDDKSAGVISSGGHLRSGWRFSFNLLDQMITRGLNLQIDNWVLSVKSESSHSIFDTATPRWLIETKRGSITTPMVVLAINTYTSHLYTPVKGFINPTRGQMLAQRPGSNIKHHIEALSRSSDSNFTNGNDYMITRFTRPASSAATDVLVGGGRQGAPGLNSQ